MNTRNTGERDSLGRPIRETARGRRYVLDARGKQQRPAGAAKRKRQNANAAARRWSEHLARAVVANAARAMTSRAARGLVAAGLAPPAAPPPRGMGKGHQGLFAAVNNDPISLSPIPMARAVRAGQHWLNSKMLSKMLEVNPRSRHPLTREPLSPQLVAKHLLPMIPTDQTMVVEKIHRTIVKAVQSRSGHMVTGVYQYKDQELNVEVTRASDAEFDHVTVLVRGTERPYTRKLVARILVSVKKDTKEITKAEGKGVPYLAAAVRRLMGSLRVGTVLRLRRTLVSLLPRYETYV